MAATRCCLATSKILAACERAQACTHPHVCIQGFAIICRQARITKFWCKGSEASMEYAPNTRAHKTATWRHNKGNSGRLCHIPLQQRYRAANELGPPNNCLLLRMGRPVWVGLSRMAELSNTRIKYKYMHLVPLLLIGKHKFKHKHVLNKSQKKQYISKFIEFATPNIDRGTKH